MSRARVLSEYANLNSLAVDTTDNEVGIASTVPRSTLDVRGETKIGTGITFGTAGVITATSYYGDGSNLSNITSTTINSNADNRVITGSGTADTLNAESNVNISGGSGDIIENIYYIWMHTYFFNVFHAIYWLWMVVFITYDSNFSYGLFRRMDICK